MLIIILLLFLILILLIVQIYCVKCVERVNYIKGSGEHSEHNKYMPLFVLSYEDFAKTVEKMELSIYAKMVCDGKSASEIGITNEQYKLIDTYVKSFNIHSQYYKYSDMNAFKENTIVVNSFNKEHDVLSVGSLVQISRNAAKMTCKSHDAYLLKFLDSEDIAVRRTGTVKENKNNFLDNIYGSYVDGVLEDILASIHTHKMYDHIIYRYYTESIKESGPIFTNKHFDIVIGVFKVFKLLKKEGSLLISIPLVFLFPIVEEFFDKLVSSFASFKFEHTKTNIFIHLYKYNGNTPTIDLQYEEIDTIYYKKADNTNLRVNCPYASSVKCNNPIFVMIDYALFDYYTNVNAQFYVGGDLTQLINENIAFRLNEHVNHNLTIDKYELSRVTNYFKDVYMSILCINSSIMSGIVKYNEIPIKINSSKQYHYPDELGKKLIACSKIDYNMSNEDERMKELYQDFTRGVSKYLSKKKGSKVSNAFVKLWEIYYKFNIINADVNAFHMCEAPGQWIKTTEYYVKTMENSSTYEWVANSLNPHNQQNIKRFGNDIIDDTYGLLKKYKDKWLFGDDDTGDITISDNIRWYRKNIENANLITGDAGLPYGMPLVYLQKLDYSQAVIVLATCAKGGNCVVKCFTPYLKSKPESLLATGFFINLIYLYYYYFDLLYLYKPYSSNPYSGEFYIIGKAFTGITNTILNDLLIVQDKFETNQTFIAQEDISEEFVCQVYNFLNNLVDLNIKTLEKRAFLHKCVNDSNDIVGFKKLIKEDHIQIIREHRFDMWVDMFKFQ